MWVVVGVTAITAVDYPDGEVAFTVGGVAGSLGLVSLKFDGEAEVVDAVLVVSREYLH